MVSLYLGVLHTHTHTHTLQQGGDDGRFQGFNVSVQV